jgi:hypothetical protein
VVSTSTLDKWLSDVEQAERYFTASFPTNFASTDQMAAYYAAKECLMQLKSDLRKELHSS